MQVRPEAGAVRPGRPGVGPLQVARLVLAGLVLGLAGCADPAEGLGPVTPAPGTLIVTVEGLPAAAAAAVTVTGPGGFNRSFTASGTVAGLAPGSYSVVAADVVAEGDSYQAIPASQTVPVGAGTSVEAKVGHTITTGRIALTVAGTPGGEALVVLTGPGGTTDTATAAGVIAGLAPGTYVLRAAEVTVAGDRYAGDSTIVLVNAGTTPTPAALSYQLASGRLDLTVAGAPAGVMPVVTVTGPGGFSVGTSGSGVLTGLPPGSYTITATDLTSNGDLWRAAIAPASVVITASATPAAASVTYQVASGRLAIGVTGLPGGVIAAVQVTGPGGSAATVTNDTTLVGLTPGSYVVTSANVVAGATLYVPQPTTQTLTVPAATSAVSATVAYAPGVGSLAVAVTGLPGGAAAAVTVTGPNGFSAALAGGKTLTGLFPGTYTVTAAGVTAGGHQFQPAAVSQAAAVGVGTTANITVAYQQTTGSLGVTVVGLPGGAAAALTVSGPGGFSVALTGDTTLVGLPPGVYTVAAASVSSGGQIYNPSPVSQDAAVTAGGNALAGIAYAGSLGGLSVTVSGLPGGTAAAVTVTGPGGFNQVLTATTTLTGLTAGSYTVAAATVSSGGYGYVPSPSSQSAPVTAGTTISRSVSYAATGKLTVTVTGLPGGAAANVTVTGPGGFNQSLTGTQTLTNLTPGTYAVAAGNTSSGGTNYAPTPTSQNAVVGGAATAAAAVAYAPTAGTSLNLTISGMYLTQAAAAFDGTTPVITGRNAYLRVFVVANEANTAAPAVRVRFYSSGVLTQTSTITAPGASVPTAVAEGTLTSSWNMAVPAALVQPNLTILADVDPTNAIAESSDADNAFPVSGTPVAVDVRTVPTFNVRFVPVLQSVNGLQGNVSAGNTATFMVDPLKLLPIATASTSVRAVYTTAAAVLQSNNGNSAWGTILSEVAALKSADASTDYYYGVVKTSYGSGVAGIGYVGGGIRTAIGWDYLPSGSSVMAHEVGHNMSLPHAPCGGPASPDPSYPYAGGGIGIWGLDVAAVTLKDPSSYKDFMSYCSPEWVSDYNWKKMITYRQSNPSYAPPAAGTVAGLLVWGRITAAGVVLEPAFRVAAPARVATGGGAYRVEGLAADGRILFSAPVDPALASGDGPAERHFAAVVPLGAAADSALVRLRLVTPAGPVERISLQALSQGGGRLFFRDPAATMTRPTPVQTRLTWDAAVYPMALVRDAATGEILSFARGGSSLVWTAGRRFDVTFSDGVRSVVRRIE